MDVIKRRIVITGEGRLSKEFLRFARIQPDTEVVMVTHRDCIDGNIPDCDILIHAGARVFADKSITDPTPFLQDNIWGTFEMLQWARRRKVGLFVYISTFEAIYPRSPYAATKAAGEGLTRAWGESYGMRWMVVRVPSVFIPDYADKGYIGALLRCEIKEPERPYRIRQWLDGPEFAERLWNVMQTVPNRVYELAGTDYSDEDIALRVEAWKEQVYTK